MTFSFSSTCSSFSSEKLKHTCLKDHISPLLQSASTAFELSPSFRLFSSFTSCIFAYKIICSALLALLYRVTMDDCCELMSEMLKVNNYSFKSPAAIDAGKEQLHQLLLVAVALLKHDGFPLVCVQHPCTLYMSIVNGCTVYHNIILNLWNFLVTYFRLFNFC